MVVRWSRGFPDNSKSRQFIVGNLVAIGLGLELVLGLGLGIEFDFKFLKFPTLNCRDFEFPTLNCCRTGAEVLAFAGYIWLHNRRIYVTE